MRKVRFLEFLVNSHPEIDHKELYARILCGEVIVGGETVKDPNRMVDPRQPVRFIGKSFASRGGEKLNAALDAWNLHVEGKIFVDAGSSTGGFTDCLLRRGAKCVHAVDVGYNQLAYGLRSDRRVISHERVNIMEVEFLDPAPDAAVADLSFRSLRGAAKHILSLTTERWMVALVKPQFEWRVPDSSFTGVVEDPSHVRVILDDLIDDLRREAVRAELIIESPIRGRKGNREFLCLLKPF